MQKNKFRFGLYHNPSSATKQACSEDARRAEDLGYDMLVVGEHFLIELTPSLAMLAMAHATQTLRVGAHLFGNDFHHPLQLAKEAATLDLLTDGRLEFGIGTGWYKEDYASTGIPLDPPMTRIHRLEEAVQILKQFFSGGKVEFSGNYYQIKLENPLPKTVQKPLPITLGGGGKHMLSLAAREADIVGLNTRTTRDGWLDFASLTREATQQKVDWIRQAAGERLDKLHIMIHFMTVKITESTEEAETIATQNMRWLGDANPLDTRQYLASPHYLVGSESFLVEKILELRETFGISDLIFWDPMEEGARLIRRLAGM